MNKRTHGFTLIELLIVVVIVGILAAIAYPSYLSHVRKTKRADAKASLVEAQNFMERYYTQGNTYVGATLPDFDTADYTFDFPEGEPTAWTYQINATPQGAQAHDSCGTLTINHQNVRGADTTGCW